MRPVWAVGVFLVVVFLGGALLAPWIYHLVQALAAVLPGLDGLASKPFARYLNRSLLILAIAGLWPFLRATDLASGRGLGLGRRSDWLGQIVWGFLLGLVSLACVVFLVLILGGRAPAAELGLGAMLGHILQAAVVAAVVAPLEEIVFRGALFGALRKTFHWIVALVLSSALYALVHFLERAEPVRSVNWSSGLVVLGSMLHGFRDLELLIPGFLNLTLAGVILALAYQRSGSLHLSIGLHAGWIFWLKTYGAVTQDANQAHIWLFGTGKLINGWLAFAVLGLTLILFSRFLVEEDPHTGWKERRLFS